VPFAITNRTPQATDLGFLVHRNPANLHSAYLSFGKTWPPIFQDVYSVFIAQIEDANPSFQIHFSND